VLEKKERSLPVVQPGIVLHRHQESARGSSLWDAHTVSPRRAAHLHLPHQQRRFCNVPRLNLPRGGAPATAAIWRAGWFGFARGTCLDLHQPVFRVIRLMFAQLARGPPADSSFNVAPIFSKVGSVRRTLPAGR